jgi:hypothetical protein
METVLRKPFQGVYNIIRFNWHFYLGASLFAIALILLPQFLLSNYRNLFFLVVSLIVFSTVGSLCVSYYIYDYSNLYDFTWTERLKGQKPEVIANINAGFDETSAILASIFPQSNLSVFDFYDPKKHTEVSIARARKAYATFPGTISIDTSALPLDANTVDLLFNIFALHEIRNRSERIAFLKLQKQSLKPGGACIIIEHLRNLPNFLAYNIGFFHFLSESEWLNNFCEAGLTVEAKSKQTPFVSVFILKAN